MCLRILPHHHCNFIYTRKLLAYRLAFSRTQRGLLGPWAKIVRHGVQGRALDLKYWWRYSTLKITHFEGMDNLMKILIPLVPNCSVFSSEFHIVRKIMLYDMDFQWHCHLKFCRFYGPQIWKPFPSFVFV